MISPKPSEGGLQGGSERAKSLCGGRSGSGHAQQKSGAGQRSITVEAVHLREKGNVVCRGLELDISFVR